MRSPTALSKRDAFILKANTRRQFPLSPTEASAPDSARAQPLSLSLSPSLSLSLSLPPVLRAADRYYYRFVNIISFSRS